MTEQTICQKTPAEDVTLLQQQTKELAQSQWMQLDREHQTQLAQRLAELIQRMRKVARQEENSHERA